ncbi:hypothetical protein [Paracoccus lutimaris]|uniref:Uncharacterized protein n=1 Tax=Paracoccus lutimaris TaxID=1490030 RepID=A0A368ZDL1_9RHOB|nr:hypothetical protein [Paracoccus lutimaris]RCW88574.1 hypothetical protein DFP89_1016 [Paracoccus lutimaris]
MNDPLEESKQQGREGAARIIADFVEASKTDYEEAVQIAVEAIRTAALNNIKSNYHLIEAVMAMAALGWEKPTD